MRLDWLAVRFGLEYLAFRTAARLFRALGLERASDWSGWLWRRIAPLSKRHDRALQHLALAFPDKTLKERERICRGMWENLGRTFAEAFFLAEIAASDRIAYEGLDAFEAWATTSAGRVACTGHFGNWELGVLGGMRWGLKPWGIYQRIKNPSVDRDVTAMRAFLYTGGLVAKSPALPRQFIRIVKEGGTVAVMADLRDYNGASVPFFGRPAPSTSFPALLAQVAGTDILVSGMKRLPGVRFVQYYEVVPLPKTGDRRADIVAATAAIQAVLEKFIRRSPDQWMWAHRRWG